MPFSEDTLNKYIEEKLEGLNRQYINVDLIVGKVTQGIYNGKNYFYLKITTFVRNAKNAFVTYPH